MASAILALQDPERRVPTLVAQLFEAIGTKFGLKKVDAAKMVLP